MSFLWNILMNSPLSLTRNGWQFKKSENKVCVNIYAKPFRISDGNLEKSPGIYLNSGIPKTYTNQPSWSLEDGSVVLDLARGRLDFTYGMNEGAFADPRYSMTK